jgi:putative Mg2+ transporter-C (MgtC) family protein
MEIVWEEVIKLGLAVLVGGLIGAEREFHDKAAGFRTIIFITFGSALFTILSLGL